MNFFKLLFKPYQILINDENKNINLEGVFQNIQITINKFNVLFQYKEVFSKYIINQLGNKSTNSHEKLSSFIVENDKLEYVNFILAAYTLFHFL